MPDFGHLYSNNKFSNHNSQAQDLGRFSSQNVRFEGRVVLTRSMTTAVFHHQDISPILQKNKKQTKKINEEAPFFPLV